MLRVLCRFPESDWARSLRSGYQLAGGRFVAWVGMANVGSTS